MRKEEEMRANSFSVLACDESFSAFARDEAEE